MKYIKYIALAGLVGLTSSCIDDLLNRPATMMPCPLPTVFTTQCGLCLQLITTTTGMANSKILAVRVSVIFLHGDPERRAADFPVCGTMHTGLSTVPTTPFSM